MTNRYRIHDFLTFDINDCFRGPSWGPFDIEHRYAVFKSRYREDVQADLVINIGPFKPSLSGCKVLDDAYYVKPDYLYHSGESGKLGGVWQFESYGIDAGRCVLNINANLAGLPFVPGRIIDFFIQYMLTKHDCLLIHAAAVAKGDRAILLSGRGGGGKTTLALGAIEQDGYRFLSDNYVLLNGGQVFSFASDLNMFGYNIHPRVWSRLSNKEKVLFRLSLMVYRISSGYIKIFTRISPLRIYGDTMQAFATPALFLSLITGNQMEFGELPRSTVVDRTLSNQKLEFFPFVRHVAQYGCVFPDSFFAQYWSRYEQLLDKQLPTQSRYHQLTLPERIDQDVIARFLSFARSQLGRHPQEGL